MPPSYHILCILAMLLVVIHSLYRNYSDGDAWCNCASKILQRFYNPPTQLLHISDTILVYPEMVSQFLSQR